MLIILLHILLLCCTSLAIRETSHYSLIIILIISILRLLLSLSEPPLVNASLFNLFICPLSCHLTRNCRDHDAKNLSNYTHCLFAGHLLLANGLRLTEVRIPNHVLRTAATQLECHFNLEGDRLYSVKWYKDSNEFYRYVPRDTPPITTFNRTGVNVDVSVRPPVIE